MENKEKYKMNEIASSNETPLHFDYLITSVDKGEERTWNMLIELSNKNLVIDHLLVMSFGVTEEEIKRNLSSFACNTICDLVYIEGEKTEYRSNVNEVMGNVGTLSDDSIVGVDITGMTTPHYFLLIKWLSKKLSHLYVYYTQPERYIMNEGLFKSYFSTVGPVSVSEIAGFSGKTANDDMGNRVLICMLGFDNDLLPVVIQDAGPQKIIAINGFPSFFPKFKDISLANNHRLLSSNDFTSKMEKTKSLSDFVYVEANNPFETYNSISEIVEEHGTYCIDVVPLGTKPMALGVCLFAINNPNVRVIFPIPETYAPSTSHKSKKTYEYVMNFHKKSTICQG